MALIGKPWIDCFISDKIKLVMIKNHLHKMVHSEYNENNIVYMY